MLLSASAAFAGGTLSNYTHAALAEAMAGGGTVEFTGPGTIVLTNTIEVATDTFLRAAPHAVTISGGGAARLFQVASNAFFRVEGATLADGKVVGADGIPASPPMPGEPAFGGAILNVGGTVALVDCVLTNHIVLGGDAGEDTQKTAAARGGDALGGMLHSVGGTVSLTNCLVIANSAEGGRGGLREFPIMGEPSGNAQGGAIYVRDGGLILHQVRFFSNQARGGAITPVGPAGQAGKGGDAFGGAVAATNSAVVLAEVFAGGNKAAGGTPPVLVMSGSGSGSAHGGTLCLWSNSVAEIWSSTFTNNSAEGGEGTRNAPGGWGDGGAIFNEGSLLVYQTIFATNTAAGGSSRNPGKARGGAIASANSLVVEGCTFFHNEADAGGRAFAQSVAAEGGAVWTTGSLAVTNATFAVNRSLGGDNPEVYGPAGGPGYGGALAVTNAVAVLVNLTVASNEVTTGEAPASTEPAIPSQGAGLYTTNSTVTLRNSLFAGNSGGGDVAGSVADAGYNLTSDNSPGFSGPGSITNANPLLSALSFNGGNTPTISLLVGSPARDAVPSGFPAADQRGVSRPQGNAADIGAVEMEFVASAPLIVNQPESQNVRAGANVQFFIVASGALPLTYHWTKEGVAIPGANTTTLSLTNVQAAQEGSYSVTVSNSVGSVASQAAVLTVRSEPLLLSQPTSVQVSPADSVNFSVTADGPDLGFQWWHDHAPMAGAINPILNLPAALAGAQGDYFVIVTNFAGAITSTVATLSFDSTALRIVLGPTNQTAEVGSRAVFDALVSGVPPFSYQWFHEGSPIPGAIERSLGIAAVRETDAGSYSVTVTNGYGSIESSPAVLTVLAGAARPVLTLKQLGQNLTITFAAEAGRNYRLLKSSDLAEWAAVGTQRAETPGPLQFVQPVADSGAAFYRVVTPQSAEPRRDLIRSARISDPTPSRP